MALLSLHPDFSDRRRGPSMKKRKFWPHFKAVAREAKFDGARLVKASQTRRAVHRFRESRQKLGIRPTQDRFTSFVARRGMSHTKPNRRSFYLAFTKLQANAAVSSSAIGDTVRAVGISLGSNSLPRPLYPTLEKSRMRSPCASGT